MPANQTSDAQQEGNSKAPKITTINLISIALAVLLVIGAFILTGNLLKLTNDHSEAHGSYIACDDAATNLMTTSDYLTTEARMFVVTGERRYADGYLNEFFVDRHREQDVATLNSNAGGGSATERLNTALSESNELATKELYAMKLTALAIGMAPMPEELANLELSSEDQALTNADKRSRAQELVFNDEYDKSKKRISSNVDSCATELVKVHEQNVFNIEVRIERFITSLGILAVLLLGLVLFVAVSNYFLVMRPMKVHARDLKEGNELSIIGSQEIQNVSLSYNELYRQATKRTEVLKHEAETDPLTGVLNRGAYDKLMGQNERNITLVLIDVDKFKEVNDTYGHEVGDLVLKKVASIIQANFRDSDYVCRIGGDEFAVILRNVGAANRKVIENKLDAIASDLANTHDECPEVTLSFGVAFAENVEHGDSLYHEADRALYASKRNGRNTKVFYGD